MSRLIGVREVAGSNPVVPTDSLKGGPSANRETFSLTAPIGGGFNVINNRRLSIYLPVALHWPCLESTKKLYDSFAFLTRKRRAS